MDKPLLSSILYVGKPPNHLSGTYDAVYLTPLNYSHAIIKSSCLVIICSNVNKDCLYANKYEASCAIFTSHSTLLLSWLGDLSLDEFQELCQKFIG